MDNEPPRIDYNICPVTGLTERERNIIIHSWRAIRGTTWSDNVHSGVAFVLWMFDNVPGMLLRFSNKFHNLPISRMAGDEKFLAHSAEVMNTIDSLIQHIHDPDTLDQSIRTMAELHVNLKPSVGTPYFRNFHQNFHLFIEKMLKCEQNSEEVRVWTTFIGSMCTAILKVESEQQQKKRKCCVTM
ncbi:unnamed protein product [Lymnaea stagnalis]|uniref:Globin n=1 Tax=Lymnaea stagnalis TaxID=6523 RepID=A0AAV2H5J5_LYMST